MKKNTNLSLQARNRLIRRNRNGKNRKKSLKKRAKTKKIQIKQSLQPE
ncbi:hypothetical protein [uncultured Gammaproteobacteria bacterium]|jgi:hypothetical protein|nr:hypothetical protein [uncultured Gammaproteobacteria bacterium]CAC9645237.1 hypothetical protein [uncultured Gammaproteobacteria bacterium]CAC9658245.1 hypothetical protein [uncultured Gammaproteobacteria bacterium]CAC9991094.1 hypothetical protein [uncultured Gammaproteobacteria bacterium]